jgi:hypothetical protein
VAHLVERARTGRAKCRGCGQLIAANMLRFGERVPNPFADDGGETTHWFHVPCAAYMRPEPFLETLPGVSEPIENRDRLEHGAGLALAHRRLPRVTTVARAPSPRAACRACRNPIEKGDWRIALMFHEEGRFMPSGYVHLPCAPAYLETAEIVDRLRYFSPSLSDADWAEIEAQLRSA